MTVIVITGAPGIGKTTVLPLIADRLGAQCAFLDGDAVGRTRPTDRTCERLNLIQDNIRACAQNFAAWGARHFVAAWVFPSQERIDRMVQILQDDGHTVIPVGLVAEEQVLLERHRNRPEDYGTDEECLRSSAGCNAGIKHLCGIHLVDTTTLSAEEVADTIVFHCKGTDARHA